MLIKYYADYVKNYAEQHIYAFAAFQLKLKEVMYAPRLSYYENIKRSQKTYIYFRKLTMS